MRDRYEELEAKGARAAAVGMGWPAMAAHFKDEHHIPFPLLVDHDKKTYRAVEMKRTGPWNLYGPPVWIKGIRSILDYGNKFPKQDPMQLGGVVVVGTGGDVLYRFRASKSSDIAPLDEVLAALQ